jgi:hypothetical protein
MSIRRMMLFTLGAKIKNLIDAFKTRVLADFGIFEAESCLNTQLTQLDNDNLLDSASFIVTPNAYKQTRLYSVVPNNTTGDMVVTRATTATRVNSSGLIENVAVNAPRIDYSNGSCPSILVEPQRTNVVLNSGNLNATTWNKTNYVLSSTSEIQGLPTTRLTKNAINNGAYNGTGSRNIVSTIGTFASGVKTLSFLIRKGNTNKAGFLINQVLVGALTAVNCEFNFNTKTFTNISLGLTASFENSTTDVYKIILTINDTGVGTLKSIWIAPIDDLNNTVDGGYLDFAFAQWELGQNATSYIPTVASTVTRNADVITNTNASTLIGQTEGTLFLNTKYSASATASGRWFNVFGTINNIGLALNGLNSVRAIINGLSDTITTSPKTNLNIKIAFAYNATGVVLFINGVQYALPNGGSQIITSLNSIVFNPLANPQFEQGNINSFMTFPTRLSNETLVQLTTL